MAQGLRGHFALLGAGMLFCTSLVGCMDNDSKPTKAPPKAASQGTPGVIGSSTLPNQKLPSTSIANNNTPATTGFGQTATRTPPATFPTSPTGTPNSVSPISGQTVPGAAGPGAPITPGGAYVPLTTPPADNGYRGSAPPVNPPTFGYDVPTPPTPPTGGAYAPVAPTSGAAPYNKY